MSAPITVEVCIRAFYVCDIGSVTPSITTLGTLTGNGEAKINLTKAAAELAEVIDGVRKAPFPGLREMTDDEIRAFREAEDAEAQS